MSTIDSNKLVQLIEEPINRLEAIIRAFNKDFSSEMSIQDYVVAKVAGVLNINLIQGIISSLASILGNVIIAAFSISFITFFFLKDQPLFFETIIIWIPDRYVENVTRALYSVKRLLTRYL